MDTTPPGQAFTKRLWPRGAEIPEGRQLTEEHSQVVALTHRDLVVIVGCFESPAARGRRVR